MTYLMYHIGELSDSEDMSPAYGFAEEAYRAALDASEESDESMIGVWLGDEESDYDLVAIAHQGDLFIKVTS